MKKIKDPVSGFTHLAAAIASVVGLVFLVIQATKWGEGAWDVVSFSIFGTGLILLYLCSSIYHLCNVSKKTTVVLRKLDHIMIYILIAATYTPICLGPLRGPWGWSIFGVVWGLAMIGLFLTIFWINAPRWLTTGIYLAMGWTVVIAVYPLITIFQELGALSSLWWLLAGGLFYTLGAILYGFKWPRWKNPYFGFHELFHLLIILGSLCQYWFIIHYVLYL